MLSQSHLHALFRRRFRRYHIHGETPPSSHNIEPKRSNHTVPSTGPNFSIGTATVRKLPIDRNQLLRPVEKIQQEMIIGGVTDLLLKVSDGDECVLCLPGPNNCFEPTAQYGIDGVTEKLHLFRSKKEDDIKIVVRRYLPNLMTENGSGVLALLYSILLTRNFDRIKEDLQDQVGTCLIDPMGDPIQALLNLIVIGKATPYLHNGSMVIGDENCGEERWGITGRNEVGFLIYDHTDTKTAQLNIGSRLKTPSLPIWVAKCNDHVGVLFNPNRELMRSHHAENRFQLYYYADAEFKKEERRETILIIDTRAKTSRITNENDDFDEMKEPPLQCAIKTKWQGADIDWQEVTPYVW